VSYGDYLFPADTRSQGERRRYRCCHATGPHKRRALCQCL